MNSKIIVSVIIFSLSLNIGNAQFDGRNITRVFYTNSKGSPPIGSFTNQNGDKWVELSQVNNTYREFIETGRNNNAVYLYDQSRDISILLDLYQNEIYIYWERPERYRLYYIAADGKTFLNTPSETTRFVEERIRIPGTNQNYTLSNLRNTLQKGGLQIVQSTQIRPGQCALIYPNTNVQDLSANFGLMMCAVKIGKQVSLKSVAVYGECDASNPDRQGLGANCGIGIGSTKLTIAYDGGQVNYSVLGPSASACASITSDRMCLNTGASFGSTSFEVSDDRGNGIGIGIGSGVSYGLDGGYEDGVISGSINLKYVAGGSISLSLNLEDVGNGVIKAGKTGYVIYNNSVVAVSNELITAYNLLGYPSITNKVVNFNSSTFSIVEKSFNSLDEDIIRPAVYDLSNWWVTATRGKKPRSLVPGEGYISVFNQAGYVTEVYASFTSNGRNYGRSQRISAGFTKEIYFPPGSTNINIQTIAIGTIDKLKMNLNFPNTNGLKNCYKCWGTIFDVEWDSIRCN